MNNNVTFQMSWSRDHAPRSKFVEVTDLFAQTACLHQPLGDGETYDVWIRATDVMNNTKVNVKDDFVAVVHICSAVSRASVVRHYLHKKSSLHLRCQLHHVD